MLVLDQTQTSRKADFIALMEKDPSSWAVVRVSVPQGAGRSVMAAARRLEGAAHEGAFIIQGPDRMSACVRSADAARLAAAAGQAGYAAETRAFAPEDSGALAAGAQKKSTLYRHREARNNNVLMVVDDDPVVGLSLGKVLSKYGDVVSLHSADGVVDAYVEKVPDLIFLDSHLDGKSGLDLIAHILKYDRDAHILMLTGDTGAQHAKEAKTHGAKSFLTKPFAEQRVEYELFQCPTFRRYAAAK